MNKVYIYIVLTLSTLIQSLAAFAQQAEVKGKVLAEDTKPQASVSVYLMTPKTNAIIKTSVTDDKGQYIFTNVPNGEFVVQASSVGFEAARSNNLQLNNAPVLVSDLVLKVSSNTIGAVTVEGKVPLVQQRDGKLVLNVENSTLAAGNTALDIIQRAPGVSVDKDNNLQLMGQAGVNVTIDGRQTYMSSEQLATYLKSMDGGQIKSVEVSTTRSAKEDAEGAVGTINIVLKKNRLEGFNGTFLASGGYGKYERANSSLSLNYKKNNTTLFGSYGFTHNKRGIDLMVDRAMVDAGKQRVFHQEANLIEKTNSHNYKFGIEQRTSPRNTMLLQFSGDNYAENPENNSVTNMGSSLTSIDSILYSESRSKTPVNRYSANFNNEFKVDTIGGKLVLDLDWSMFRNDARVDYTYNTYFPDGSLVRPTELERSYMPVDIDIYVAKLDFLKTIGKGKLELGAKYSNVKSDNNLGFEHFVNGQWQEFEGRPNHFIYTEQIAAAYADYSRVYGKMSIKAGLRGEYTFSDGNSITMNNHVKRDYLDLFPSANIGYTVNENNILSLGYARKVARPNYRNLNPFEYYIDKFTSQRGNPYLKPQYTDGFTLNYTVRKMYNITLGADITNDAMVESMGQNTETGQAWITKDNLGKSWTSYLNVNVPVRIGKIWTMNNNLTGIYMHFKGPIVGSYVDDGSFFFQGRSMNNFRMSKALSAELSVNYNSAFLYNVYQIGARWGTDVGINYNFKDQRSSLKLAGTDIFKTQKNNITTNFAEFDSKIRQYNDNRTVRLTYTYKFGNLKQQLKRNNTDSDEKNRAQ
ncbi:outer membrane beta-barrel family protein [Sphingobacterium psychroaquaticum]|uniref:Outer membrane receptor proteins, mostly Fe transport n=1 Tax=Sphingobacterium psychroaquaticum TaxID=561061 RepID=A0A1X7KFN1_9SPHI|nr:outer membrane beta-barrel family protein [Sphingobacterium psychroaquaticum]SMG40079.1 Outer membrane receptor proteins, mostly Fe transport [Sphingobacterium psychroaquaticum]